MENVIEMSPRRTSGPRHVNPARAQRLFLEITRKAAEARRDCFQLALEQGQTLDELAVAAGLDVDEVRAALAAEQ